MARSFAVEVESGLCKGFYEENVMRIVRLLSDARREPQTANPISYYAVESVLARVHARWLERQPSTVSTGILLEARLVPPIVAVLRATDDEPAELLAALNALLRTYDSAVSEIPVDSIA